MDSTVHKSIIIMLDHMALDGKTPAEARGIEIKGKDKWKTLIQNASQT